MRIIAGDMCCFSLVAIHGDLCYVVWERVRSVGWQRAVSEPCAIGWSVPPDLDAGRDQQEHE